MEERKASGGSALNPLRHPFLVLLVFLVLQLTLYPVLKEMHFLGRYLFSVFTLFVLFATVRSVTTKRRERWVLFVLAGLVVALQFVDGRRVPELFLRAGLSLHIALLLYMTVLMLRYALRREGVTAEKIYAAICVYLFVGYLWALVYTLLEAAAPGSFQGMTDFAAHGLAGEERFAVFSYYSFVTLTTLGYGDIVPATGLAASLASCEAVTGQLFIAVLLARLVALHVAHETSRS